MATLMYNPSKDYTNYVEKIVYNTEPYSFEPDLIEISKSFLSYSHSSLISTLIEIENEQSKLSSINEAIEGSKFILDLKLGWDGEDAPSISEDLYRKVLSYLIKVGTFIYKNYNKSIQGPSINPCKDGTIDLEWKVRFNHLLINVKDDINGLDIHYYGFNSETNNSIKGIKKSMDIDEDLAFWMKKLG